MEITEEQRMRAEANRIAALEKRKRMEERLRDGHWRFFRCRKIPSSTSSPSSSALVPEKKPSLLPRMPEPPEPLKRFVVVLEICSPDEFAVLPEPLPGFIFPGVVECFRIIEAAIVSVLHFRISESQGSQGCLRAFVYKLNDYDLVLKCLRKLSIADLQDIPYITLLAIRSFQDHVSIGRIPCWKEHYSEKQVDDLMLKLPRTLKSALLPFQLDGVRFGLLRGARCLIADEMGLGKTIQAIAIAACFIDKGPILIVCPAVLRFTWAEELEHWLPSLLPRDLHLVFGRQNSLDYLEHCPKIVVISYTMLSRLRRSMLNREWALMIVDESHNLRCTKKKSEHKETKIVLDIATKIDHIVLLSGTPSLTRPGLLGKDKYEFAKSYCKVKVAHGSQGSIYKDFSKGVRLEELNVLLREYVMIRRLKEHVLTQLPPKRRQIIMLKLKVADISIATTMSRVNSGFSGDVNVSNQSVVDNHVDQNNIDRSEKSGSFNLQNDSRGNSKLLTFQEIGIAKLSGFREWFSSHVADDELENAHTLGIGFGSQKFIIFAHHIKVLDGIQEFVCEKGIQFVRIDGSTLSKDRKTAVESFRLSSEVRIAIIGITAGGVGLDFSSAQNVVFLELPKSASEMLQAEDRAHRRGQTNAVNIYIFCAKGTCDESHWMHLNRSLFRVSSMMNGKYDAVKEIEVNGVLQLENPAYGVGTNEVAIRAYTCKGEHRVQSITKNITLTQPLESEICIPDKESMKLDSAEKIPNKEGFQQLQIITVDGTYCEVDACEEGLIKEEHLRFEVSHYTGRVHLYICLPGMDLRPRPLFVNFRQEELDSIVLLICLQEKESVSQLLKENPRYFHIFQTFIEEWNSLRPIERCKLLGKPLQLPLSIELCYLKEATNHGSSGLLKGGSKRRVTPLNEISHSLPENAVWKKVVLHGCFSKGKEYTQAFSVGGKPLCKLCHVPCNGKLSTVPEFFEDLFCNIDCFQEYRIRTSQKALRKELFGIEHGVCVMCSLDCHKLVKSLMPLSIANRRSYVEKIAPGLAKKKKLLDKLVCAPVEGNAWHADHIVPVFKGGGECRLENMRTLCVACHAEVTKAQGVERRLARKRAREQLKITMKSLEHCDDGENKGGCSTLSSGALEVVGSEGAVGGEASEDLLLVHVPGSAYSETREKSPRES